MHTFLCVHLYSNLKANHQSTSSLILFVNQSNPMKKQSIFKHKCITSATTTPKYQPPSQVRDGQWNIFKQTNHSTIFQVSIQP